MFSVFLAIGGNNRRGAPGWIADEALLEMTEAAPYLAAARAIGLGKGGEFVGKIVAGKLLDEFTDKAACGDQIDQADVG